MAASCTHDGCPARLLLVCLAFVAAVLTGAQGGSNATSNHAAGQPTFVTKGATYRIKTNDTVVLPCEVKNPGSYVLAWKRGIAILTASSVKVSPDERLRLVDGYNLEIRDVAPSDAGDYTCQIGTLEPKEITQTLEILVPPRMQQKSTVEDAEVKKGETAKMECRASGNPVPTITWTRKNNVLPTGEQSYQGNSLAVERANRHHAGVYYCTASNGVGNPVTKQVNLHVLYPPEIEVESSWVHTGEGREVQLVCIVHSDPPAEVVWFKDTLRLDSTDRRIMEARGSRRTLILRKVQTSDFGNYTCVADNGLGKSRQSIELSGKPNRPVFLSERAGWHRDSYNLSWSVDSYTPVEEFKLLFRKMAAKMAAGALPEAQQTEARQRERQMFGKNDSDSDQEGKADGWLDVLVPAVPSEQLTQRAWHVIRQLQPGASYEAKVRARNRFGWGEQSPSFQFATSSSESALYQPSPEPAIYEEPAARDLGMRAYSSGAKSPETQCVLVAALAVLARTVANRFAMPASGAA
ncbi:neuronal growth regulator 1-like [Bacillus rossius redtenbacheri]|uniref:neuronal growth regulator 1-like n=1 Tax=Bacillus rossius redtenbacheri TaxID=93214 RepID=UPI002FDEB483